MNPQEIKEAVLQYKWEHWADRPFGAFMLSFFRYGNSRKYMRKAGVDAELPAMLFQKGAYYKSEEVWDLLSKQLESYIDKGGSVFKVVEECEQFGVRALDLVKDLVKDSLPPLELLSKLREAISVIYSHVWLTHGFEHLYLKKLHQEIPKYFQGDVDKFIGDVSFPSKKNKHVYFEESLRGDGPLEEVRENFGWIKARDGFSDIFSIGELTEERKRLQSIPQREEFVRPEIPTPLRELVSIAQELVYFRTMRTDYLYEILYHARPLLQEVAEIYGLKLKDLRDYSVYDLLSGNLEKYEYGKVGAVAYGEHFALLDSNVFEDEEFSSVTEFKGAIAFKGKVRGRVKVVMTAYEIGKVQEGDVLVAPTTAPSYIIGMQKAVAFVTDEGGITSHAAIVSREMKKPCIIGTKMATKVLKDGDLVEVDAEKGVVRMLNIERRG